MRQQLNIQIQLEARHPLWVRFLNDITTWVNRGCPKHKNFDPSNDVGSNFAAWAEANKLPVAVAANMAFTLAVVMQPRNMESVAQVDTGRIGSNIYKHFHALTWVLERI